MPSEVLTMSQPELRFANWNSISHQIDPNSNCFTSTVYIHLTAPLMYNIWTIVILTLFMVYFYFPKAILGEKSETKFKRNGSWATKEQPLSKKNKLLTVQRLASSFPKPNEMPWSLMQRAKLPTVTESHKCALPWQHVCMRRKWCYSF